MKRIFLLCLLLSSLGANSLVTAEEVTPLELVQKVVAAEKFLAAGGEEALKQFNDPESEWSWSGTYLFVLDSSRVTVVAHPVKPELINKDLSDLRDVKGKAFFVELCNAPKKNGWVEYFWPKPGEQESSRKISYVRQVPGTKFQVGGGLYEDALEIEELEEFTREYFHYSTFTSPKEAAAEVTPLELVQKVVAAEEFLAAGGEGALKQFNDPESEWSWSGTYLFVLDASRVTAVAHPVKPELINKDLSDLRDVKGKAFFVELCNAPKKNGWVEYFWPKPGEQESSRKISYVRQVPGTKFQVGGGLYEDTIKIEELEGFTKEYFQSQELKNER